jgi:hypothetical protein
MFDSSLVMVGAQRNKWEIEFCLCKLSKIPSRFLMMIIMMMVKKVLAVVVEAVWSCFKSQMDKRGK